MPDWVIVGAFAIMHTVYASAVEGLLTWAAAKLFLGSYIDVNYWIICIFLAIPNFIWACWKFTKYIKEDM